MLHWGSHKFPSQNKIRECACQMVKVHTCEGSCFEHRHCYSVLQTDQHSVIMVQHSILNVSSCL
jgi:hypothetical protein